MTAASTAKAEAGKKTERVETLLTVDPMELEVGYGLMPYWPEVAAAPVTFAGCWVTLIAAVGSTRS